MSYRVHGATPRYTENDYISVREKTLGRVSDKPGYRCIVCGDDVPPYLTPSGAKVYSDRCVKHPKERT